MNSISGVGIYRSVFMISRTCYIYINMCMCVLIFCVIRWGICRKCLCDWIPGWTQLPFLWNTIFTLKEWLTNYAIQAWVILPTCSHKSMNWTCHSRQITDSICCQWKNLRFQVKIIISIKPVSAIMGLTLVGKLVNFFFILNNEK